MSNRTKPLALLKGHHVSKAEQAKRQEAETKMKGKVEDILNVPSFLDAEGKRLYKRTLKLIGPEGTDLLCDSDKDSLTTYAAAVSILKQCTKEINQNGVIVGGQPNPAVKMFENYSKIVKSFSAAFGLDPFSRSKLALTNLKEEEKPISEEEMLFGDV